VRIATASSDSGVRHVAVQNPDGSFALVLTNPGEAKDLRVIQRGQQVNVALPRNAVATLAW
jgi:O-glycosyl hydrolase